MKWRSQAVHTEPQPVECWGHASRHRARGQPVLSRPLLHRNRRCGEAAQAQRIGTQHAAQHRFVQRQAMRRGDGSERANEAINLILSPQHRLKIRPVQDQRDRRMQGSGQLQAAVRFGSGGCGNLGFVGHDAGIR